MPRAPWSSFFWPAYYNLPDTRRWDSLFSLSTDDMTRIETSKSTDSQLCVWPLSLSTGFWTQNWQIMKKWKEIQFLFSEERCKLLWWSWSQWLLEGRDSSPQLLYLTGWKLLFFMTNECCWCLLLSHQCCCCLFVTNVDVFLWASGLWIKMYSFSLSGYLSSIKHRICWLLLLLLFD